ncbi:2421_t:CDS:2, partial [Gigaspora margarita]
QEMAPFQDISAILHLWNNSIRTAKEIKKYGDIAHRKRSGRPKKITPALSKALGQYIRKDPAIASRTLATKLLDKGVKVTHVTVCNHLNHLGYKKNQVQATPMLTKDHIKARIAWAEKHLNDNWEYTVFSDKTCQKICAWAAFWAGDGHFYTNILKKHIPKIKKVLGNRWRFQQDNDSKHRSRVAKKFIEKNIPLIIDDWPSNSPDLNPIENLWEIVKTNVEKCYPKNLDELEQFTMEEWDKIPINILKNLSYSIYERCRLILVVNGDCIPY